MSQPPYPPGQPPYGQPGQPPHGQPPYGQPYGAPPATSGLTPTAAIWIAYLLHWVGSLVVLGMEKNNQNVRFHAMQSFIMSIFFLVAYIILVPILITGILHSFF